MNTAQPLFKAGVLAGIDLLLILSDSAVDTVRALDDRSVTSTQLRRVHTGGSGTWQGDTSECHDDSSRDGRRAMGGEGRMQRGNRNGAFREIDGSECQRRREERSS